MEVDLFFLPNVCLRLPWNVGVLESSVAMEMNVLLSAGTQKGCGLWMCKVYQKAWILFVANTVTYAVISNPVLSTQQTAVLAGQQKL